MHVFLCTRLLWFDTVAFNAARKELELVAKTQVFNSLSMCQNTLKVPVNTDTDSSTTSKGCRAQKGTLLRFSKSFFARTFRTAEFFSVNVALNKDICLQNWEKPQRF